MQIGMIGLGRMGANIVRRLANHGHQCVVFDVRRDLVQQMAKDRSMAGASALADLVRQLEVPRAVWVMLPAGAPTEDTVMQLAELLERT